MKIGLPITHFELTSHVAVNSQGDVVADFDQWILGVNKIHAGYVQKSSGIVHLIERVTPDAKKEILRRVAEETGFENSDASMPPEIPTETDDDDDELS